MSDYSYLKKAIKKKRLSLKTIANHTGITAGYLNQLMDNLIKNPTPEEIEKLHEYLNLSNDSKKVGIIFGKFYPLHTGHIYIIQRAISQVDELHIIMCHDDERDYALFKNSAMSKQPNVMDRLRWLLQTFKYQKNIHIHDLDESGIPSYPNGWKDWSLRVQELLKEKEIRPSWVYSSEPQDAPLYKEFLGLDTELIDPDRSFMKISATQIRKMPLKYWDFIPTEVRPFFVKTVAILGGESSGKSTLVNKLANLFNTTSAWEYGREYVFQKLGGDERALQYSDYAPIALGQAQYIDFSIKHANKLTFVDTDFLTTQAFCLKYEGSEHPFVQAMIDEYRFDLVILLNNNTPWIADGLRHLGNQEDRTEFQNILIEMLIRNKISFTRIESADYDERFLECVILVQKLLTNKIDETLA